LEFRLLPPSILRQKLIHSFFHHLALSTSSPFKSLYLQQLDRPPPKSCPRYARHLVSNLLDIDGLVPLKHSADFKSNTSLFLNFFYDQWKSGAFPYRKKASPTSVGKKLLPFYADFSPTVPPYLRFDSKPTVCHRARLRFDLAKNNASLQSRGLSNSAACLYCPDVTDTREHILLQCPRHFLARLNVDVDSLSLPSILNPLTQSVATSTSNFINSVVKARDI
jgi:hypothetical protein